MSGLYWIKKKQEFLILKEDQGNQSKEHELKKTNFFFSIHYFFRKNKC